MDAWKDIATAPINGTLVDLWCVPNDIVFESDKPRMLTGFWNSGDDEWNVYATADADGAVRLSRMEMRATHWMLHRSPPAPPDAGTRR